MIYSSNNLSVPLLDILHFLFVNWWWWFGWKVGWTPESTTEFGCDVKIDQYKTRDSLKHVLINLWSGGAHILKIS